MKETGYLPNRKLITGSLLIKAGIYKIFFFTFTITACLAVVSCRYTDIPHNADHRIIITGTVSPDFQFQLPENEPFTGNLHVQYTPLQHVETKLFPTVLQEKVKNGSIKWEFYADTALLVLLPMATAIIVYPGDSIHISYIKNDIIYSGKASDTARINFMNLLMNTEKLLARPTQRNYRISSPDEFFQWNQYADQRLALQLPLIEVYKSKLTDMEYNYYKTSLISSAESNRVSIFNALISYARKDSLSGISNADLNVIWDTTQYKPWAVWVRSLSDYPASIRDVYSFNRLEVQRKFNFDLSSDSLSDKEKRTYLYYMTAKNEYKGLMRERLLTYILHEPVITEIGLENSMTQLLLNDYYSLPGYPEYKQWVKKLEENAK